MPSRFEAGRKPGVIHQHVDFGEPGRQCGDCLLNGAPIADVKLDDVHRLGKFRLQGL